MCIRDRFCSLPGNEGICQLPKDFIGTSSSSFSHTADPFNLSGLRQQIDHFEDAYRVLLGEERGEWLIVTISFQINV